jgi:riboflavin biosynthesis pyrimidine reductase
MKRERWIARFDEVVERKSREAASVDLARYRTVPGANAEHGGGLGELEAIGNEWTRCLFDGDFYTSPPPAGLPSTNLVFVQSRDGNTGTRNPSTLGGGATDKHLIYEGLSRVAADGVLAGASTIRRSGVVLSVWHDELVRLRESLGLPRHPVQVVATLGGLTFDDTLLLNVPGLPAIVITTPPWIDRMSRELADRPWITPLPIGGADDLRGAFRTMRSMGLRRISAIGGRTIARAMLDAGLIQDLYLTTSPREGGEPDTPVYPGKIDGTVVVMKEGTGPETGVTFEHRVLAGGRVL